MKKFLSIVLATVILSTSFASATNMDKVSVSEPSTPEQSSTMRRISREEYIQSLAIDRGITYEQADEQDKLHSQRILNQDSTNASPYGASMPRATVAYVQLTKQFDLGSSSFKSTLEVAVQAKVTRYTVSSIGVYQKYAQVLQKTVYLVGAGTGSVEKEIITAEICNDATYSNAIQLLVNGVACHATTSNVSASASAAGFDVGASIGTTHYYRKPINVRHLFGSNEDLN